MYFLQNQTIISVNHSIPSKQISIHHSTNFIDTSVTSIVTTAAATIIVSFTISACFFTYFELF